MRGGGGAGRVAQVVECLPSAHEALSSNPSAIKTKTKNLMLLHDLLYCLPPLCSGLALDFL
jgi:hypothetical protein